MLGRSCPQIALCAQPTRIAVSSPDQDLGQLVVSGAISTAMTKIEPTEYLEQQQQQPKQRHHQLGPNTNANTDTDTDTACKRGLATDRGGMPTMTRLTKRVLLLSCIASASAVSSEDVSGKISPPPYPSLRLVETTLRTTAKLDFGGHEQPFQEATRWSRERLRASRGDYEPRAPHLACAEYGHGREAASRLKAFLSREAVRPVYHASEHGACFLATASDAQAAAMSADPARFELTSIGAFPSALKIAPDLLDHDSSASFRETYSAAKEGNNESGRLTTRHGYLTRIDGIEGLSVELSPGTLPARSLEADAFIRNLLEGLMSESVDLHACNFWSDPSMSGGEHLARPEGALRGREWSRAATVVHELSEAAGTTPGDVCSWGGLSAHHAANDVLLVSGLDHLLYGGRGAGGQREESDELHVACFMGLVSFLAGRNEVLRVSPWEKKFPLNSSARANIQSGTVTATPLTDAGLDGTGEIIQVLDSGLDETSCYFEDGDGLEVTHGFFFDRVGVLPVTSSQTTYVQGIALFTGGDFFIDTTRRKVVQYINMVKPDDTPGSSVSSFTTAEGVRGYYLPADSFSEDDRAGHGSHTAGSAAGSTLTSPAEPITCVGTDLLSCAGGCIDDNLLYPTDDLLPPYEQISITMDIDRICPLFGCDETASELCLSDDVPQTLTDNGGMAQGAKLSIFDVFYQKTALSTYAGNELWEPCMEAGCKLHSNSYGGDLLCSSSSIDAEYDDFMYNNPENLLIFAAGNDGTINDGRSVCTISTSAIAKNILAVGATSSGESRITSTARDGTPADGTNGSADVDTVASFSSYGPTQDNRIKPEIVAPGDLIYSAASDGSDEHSCRLYAYAGTSMSCPIVAGASAMIRQYFVDSSFYAADVTARGFCDQGFPCEGFSPSSATVKAMLINSANLMGGSSEPDGFRGFGRVHLEQGIPLDGEGDMSLFVADAANTSISELTQHEYLFDIDADAGLDLRATLSWIDPAATALSAKQLVHDLDLAVRSPSGATYTMWASGAADEDNVNERVIVDAADVESGTWAVWVWAQALSTDSQSYSLVVNGAISPGAGDGTGAGGTGPFSSSDPPSLAPESDSSESSLPASDDEDSAATTTTTPSPASSNNAGTSGAEHTSTPAAAAVTFLSTLFCSIASTLAVVAAFRE